MCFGPAENPRRVADTGWEVVPAYGDFETLQLLARHGLVALVGACQMGHKADLAWRHLQALQPFERGGELFRPKAEAVHAGVNLEPQNEGVHRARLLQKLNLPRIVHDKIKCRARGIGELFAGECAFQEHDRLFDAGIAQHDALIKARNAEGIRLGKRQRRLHQAMTVGVGLHHRDHARLRRKAAQRPQVCAQCASIDDGPDEPAHFNTPSA